jgi:hypothetical protein
MNPITNRSFHILSKNLHVPDLIKETLGLGLKHILTAKPPSYSTILSSITKFRRSFLIKHVFSKRPTQNPNRKAYVPQFYVPNLIWQPPSISEHEEHLFNALLFSLRQEAKPLIDKHQLDYQIPFTVKYLKRFSRNQDFKIIPTDKNLGLALISNEDYMDMVVSHLNDTTTYQHQPGNDINQLRNNILPTLSKLNNRAILLFGSEILSLDRYLSNFQDNTTQVPKFHCLAKIHKTPIKGRPIAGAVNWLTTGISALLSYKLRDIVKNLHSVVQDTRQLIRNLEGISLSDSDLLVSVDVEALYPSMDQDITINAVRSLTATHFSEAQHNWLIDATQFVLKNSFVEFNGQIYHQIKGMAMGTNAAVELANLYVYFLLEERKKFDEVSKRYAMKVNPEKSPLLLQYFLPKTTKNWTRYLDDIFFTWKYGTKNLELFIQALNDTHPSLRFTFSYHQNHLPFLDTIIFKHNNQITFRIFQKPLNKFLYIPFTSNHPIGAKKGFIIGELIRYVRNCTLEQDFNEVRSLFRLRLEVRGYPKHFINSLFNQVSFHQRDIYLSDINQETSPTRKSEKLTDTIQKLFITLPFHPLLHQIKLRNRLQHYVDHSCPEIRFQVMISHQNHPNIGSLSTSSNFNNIQRHSSHNH